MAVILFIVCYVAIWSALEGAPILSATIPGTYGGTLTLSCSDAGFSTGDPYYWEKSGLTIFTDAGEQGTIGKYIKSEASGIFTLSVLNLVVSDEGSYKCNFNFQSSSEKNVTVQSEATVSNTDGGLVSDLLEIIFSEVYPAFSSAVITCNMKQIPGSFDTPVPNMDRFNITWRSTYRVFSDDVSPGCSADLFGAYTSPQTLPIFSIRDVCGTQNPCQNGGTCTNTKYSYSCTCGVNFLGTICQTECLCGSTGLTILILCSIAVALTSAVIILLIVFVLVGPTGNVVACNLTAIDTGSIVSGVAIGVYAVIVGAVGVAENRNCRNCPSCDVSRCDVNNGLGIASIVMGVVGVGLATVLLVKRKGWCGERLTCLNTVLPVCTDTEARGCPDGKSDNPAAKEKHREVKLLTQKEQTQQHHKETVENKGKPSGEKHEELSKGQPRPLPVPTGNNRDDTGSAGAVSRQDVVLDRRPMPDIPSDRHKRGLSANYSDDRDKPLDDNILHTLPVVKKPKNALDPMNDEGKSKNSDDQPKKKKKKKKDHDTSRSGEMEDDIDSHGKVLAF